MNGGGRRSERKRILKNILRNSKVYIYKHMLLHICCGVCGLWPVYILKEKFKDLTLFFYNPNIQPKEEYLKRLKFAKKLSEIYNVPLIEGEYNVKDWFKSVKGLENEPEGGKRCEICFKFRLEKTAKKAKELGFEIFSTTLTISPHKNAKIINKIGKEISQKYKVEFLETDFKKKDGFKNTMKLAKKYNFYRQNYCGCIFSKLKIKIRR